MVISPLWLQGAILTFVAGFAVMIYLAVNIYQDRPPIPGRVVDPAGRVIFTRDDISSGQSVFEQYQLMEYGTLFGHGAYLGPDFTAEYLHTEAELMAGMYGTDGAAQDGLAPVARVAAELHQNRYDPTTDTLTFTAGQVAAFDALRDFYTARFNAPSGQTTLPPRFIQDPTELHHLTAYFSWATWVTTADRPGNPYSYTANWPPELLAGNLPTGDSVVWSVLSIIAILGGTGLVLFFFGRYDWLGWRGADLEQRRVRFYPPG